MKRRWSKWRKTIHFNYYKCSFLPRFCLISCDKTRRFDERRPIKRPSRTRMSEIYSNASISVIIDDENSITFTTKKRAQEEARLKDDEKLYFILIRKK